MSAKFSLNFLLDTRFFSCVYSYSPQVAFLEDGENKYIRLTNYGRLIKPDKGRA